MKAQAMRSARIMASPIRPSISPHERPSWRLRGVARELEFFCSSCAWVTPLVYGGGLPQVALAPRKGDSTAVKSTRRRAAIATHIPHFGV